MKYLVSIFIAVIGSQIGQSYAQEIVPEILLPITSISDTSSKPESRKHYFEYSPKRAGMYAAILPGSGQIYNKQYWKVPIVYAGIGTGVGFIIYNLTNYNQAREEIAARATVGAPKNTKFVVLDNNQLQQLQDYHRQNLDVSALLTGVAYFLQIIDAVVSNHLKGFDITPDISMKINPFIVRPQQVGVGIAFNIH